MKIIQSCPILCDPMDLYSPLFSPGQNTRMGSLSLLQGIFPTQGSDPGLPHCRRIPYHLSHQGSPFTSLIPWLPPRPPHTHLWIMTILRRIKVPEKFAYEPLAKLGFSPFLTYRIDFHCINFSSDSYSSSSYCV